jgi:anti-sigma factor RsiW
MGLGMGRPVIHDEAGDLLGAYALDAVEASEASAIREHVAACPRCAEEVAEHQQTIALLANTGGDSPAHVWDLISSRIEGPPRVGPRHMGEPRGRRQSQAPRGRKRPGAHVPRRPGAGVPRRWWTAAAAATAVAAAVVIAVLGVQVAHLDRKVSRLSSAANGQGLSAAVQSALLDPAGRRITLAAAGAAARAGEPARLAEIVILPAGAAYLLDSRLPVLAAGRTYQLWGVNGGKAISLGLLGGHPVTVAFTLSPANPTTVFAITVEPEDGTVAPTQSPVASS